MAPVRASPSSDRRPARSDTKRLAVSSPSELRARTQLWICPSRIPPRRGDCRGILWSYCAPAIVNERAGERPCGSSRSVARTVASGQVIFPGNPKRKGRAKTRMAPPAPAWLGCTVRPGEVVRRISPRPIPLSPPSMALRPVARAAQRVVTSPGDVEEVWCQGATLMA
jgi:hypothetical protein